MTGLRIVYKAMTRQNVVSAGQVFTLIIFHDVLSCSNYTLSESWDHSSLRYQTGVCSPLTCQLSRAIIIFSVQYHIKQ